MTFDSDFDTKLRASFFLNGIVFAVACEKIRLSNNKYIYQTLKRKFYKILRQAKARLMVIVYYITTITL